MKDIKVIEEKIIAFKRRYYLNLAIKGGAITLSLILCYALIASIIEYYVWMSGTLRFFVLLSLLGLLMLCFVLFMSKPFSWWVRGKGLGQEESAKIIGSFFSASQDQLLNLIQLSAKRHRTDLLEAGILQKSKHLEKVPFDRAIDLSKNRRYIKFFLIPLGIILILLFTNHTLLTQSAGRIMHFNQEFSPTPPFSFHIQNENLKVFLNEPFTLNLRIEGSDLPTHVYIVSGSQQLKMMSQSESNYTYAFGGLQKDITFRFEADGFYSDSYLLSPRTRPELTQIKVMFNFPRYLSKSSETLLNTGYLEVPEGTDIAWEVDAQNTTSAKIGFVSSNFEKIMKNIDNQYFTHNQRFFDPDQYWITLENKEAQNKERITYTIDIIKDQHPEIAVNRFYDSVSYENALLGGYVDDDYGVTALLLNYEKTTLGLTEEKRSIPIPIKRNQTRQNFFYSWALSSLHLKPGDKIQYFLEVWDNDGVNGHKATRSPSYTLILPNEEEIKKSIGETQNQTEATADKSLKKAKNLGALIDEAQQKLRGKKIMRWEEKKMLESILRKKDSLEHSIQELQKQNQMLNNQQDSFLKQSERITEKTKQIQKLMNELFDEETKQLFEELQKLMDENANLNQIQQVLEKMSKKEVNMERELKRMLDLLNQLHFDYKLDQAIEELKDQIKEQKYVLEKTRKMISEKEKKRIPKKEKHEPFKKSEKKEQNLAEKQSLLSENFERLEEKLNELDSLSKKIGKENNMLSQEETETVKEAQQKSKQSLEQNNPDESSKWQEKSIQKMQDIQKELESMQSTMQFEQDTQNLVLLRQILHSLIMLSYNQESLMKNLDKTQRADPKYRILSREQVKLKDDFKPLEDSLLSLSSRDPFMGSFIMREIGELNEHLSKVVDNMKAREEGNTLSEMQLSMTSINNLALMLSDHFDMMSNAMSPGNKGEGKKDGDAPGLGEMQKKLNQQIRELKNSGKTGRPLSEELATIVAEQERIRRLLQEMQKKLEQEGGNSLSKDLPRKIEQSEMDLLNKKLTEDVIKRQEEILTRLLETEQAAHEQGIDEKREGTTAKEYEKEIPAVFKQYLKWKEKEVELLNTLPPTLHPYYKKEAENYFKRIKTVD